jgi:hypothetical protein
VLLLQKSNKLKQARIKEQSILVYFSLEFWIYLSTKIKKAPVIGAFF